MILIALGANLPWNGTLPDDTLRQAIQVLDRLFTVTKRSSLYRSSAWPDPNDPPFVNAVIACEMSAAPLTILKALHTVEAAFGRRRSKRNAPRTLDLDLLAVDQQVIAPTEEGGLVLPHPGLSKRGFVLVPLVDILPEWVHPVTGKTAQSMLDALPENGCTLLSST